MKTIILIFLFNLGTPDFHVTMQEFSSKDKCEKTGEMITVANKAMGGNSRTAYQCIEK